MIDSRYGFLLPNAVVDLQKGERYGYYDSLSSFRSHWTDTSPLSDILIPIWHFSARYGGMGLMTCIFPTTSFVAGESIVKNGGVHSLQNYMQPFLVSTYVSPSLSSIFRPMAPLAGRSLALTSFPEVGEWMEKQ